jgi:two-component system, sporulation sensor kinase B
MFHQKKERIGKTILLLTILTSLILTMSFPVQIGDGHSYDFKIIPIFVAFLYAGPLAGISCIGILLLFNLMDGGQFFLLAINYAILGTLLYFGARAFQTYTLKKKLCLIYFFYSLVSLTRLIIFAKNGQGTDFIQFVLFTIVSYAALTIVIYLVERNIYQFAMLQQLQNADKLNAISQLAASVAHEIRNPMTTIRGFMQILKDEENLTPIQSRYISVSLEELDRTQLIIDDFLSLARPITNEYGTISVSKVLIEIIDFMRPYGAISNVQLMENIENDIGMKGSASELKQLLLNILKNGIEAMPDRGILSIFSFRNGENAVVIIRDNGIGLTKQQISQLGQPYYSTKTKGTGLGLMISFNLIKRMHGKVQIDSQKNIGTSFTITFPFENVE